MRRILAGLIVLLCLAISGYGQTKVMSLHTTKEIGKNKADRKIFQKWMKAQALDVVSFQDLQLPKDVEWQKMAKKWKHKYTATAEIDGKILAISSKFPITSMPVGTFLKASTNGIDFYMGFPVGDSLAAQRSNFEALAQHLPEDMETAKVVVLTSFESYAPADSAIYTTRFKLIPKDKRADKAIITKLGSYQRSRNYVLAKALLATGLEDVMAAKKDPTSRAVDTTYPTKVYGKQPRYNTFRYDFIFTSMAMTADCQEVKVLKSEATDYLSAHYPVVATFK